MGTMEIKKIETSNKFSGLSLILLAKTIAVNKPISRSPKRVAEVWKVDKALSLILIKCQIFAQPSVSFEYPPSWFTQNVNGSIGFAPNKYAGIKVANKPRGRA